MRCRKESSLRDKSRNSKPPDHACIMHGLLRSIVIQTDGQRISEVLKPRTPEFPQTRIGKAKIEGYMQRDGGERERGRSEVYERGVTSKTPVKKRKRKKESSLRPRWTF